jgi:hypothetical protein
MFHGCGRVRTVFEVFVVVQLMHLAEHIVQLVQIHAFGWPAAEARGVVSALDVERVHAAWNLLVLGALAWLLARGVRSSWLGATLVWATLHTAEHAYLLGRAVLTGLEGEPGVLGAGGLLARSGIAIAGLTSWSRPTVHFAWNAIEVALLVAAYLAFRGVPGRHTASTASPSSVSSCPVTRRPAVRASASSSSPAKRCS